MFRKTLYTTGSDVEIFFFPSPSQNSSKLVQATPVYQIQGSLIESDWRGPPRPLQAAQGLCECVSVRNYDEIILLCFGFSFFVFFLFHFLCSVCVCVLGLGH